MQAQWAEAISHENEKLHQLSELQRGIIADLQRQGGAPDLAVAEAPAGPRHDSRSHSAMHAKHPSEANSPVRGLGTLTRTAVLLSCKPEDLSSAMELYVTRSWAAAVATQQDLERAVGGPCRTASAQHGQQATARRGAEAPRADKMDLRLLQEQLAKVRTIAALGARAVAILRASDTLHSFLSTLKILGP